MEENNGSVVSGPASCNSGRDRQGMFVLSAVKEETGESQISISVDTEDYDYHHDKARKKDATVDFRVTPRKKDHHYLLPNDEEQQLQDQNIHNDDYSLHESSNSLIEFSLEDDVESGESKVTQRKVKFRPRSPSNGGLFRNNSRNNSLTSSTRQLVHIRRGDSRNAMDEKARRWYTWRKGVSDLLGLDDEPSSADDYGIGGAKVSMHGRLMVQPSRRVLDIPTSDQDVSSNDDEEAAAEKKREQMQYRLTTVKGKMARDISIAGMYEDLAATDGERCCCCCMCHRDVHCERIISAFLHWSFRSPFTVVFGSAAVLWMLMTFIFAFFIWLLGMATPHCIGGVDFEHSPARFLDAYHLSWTTFLTVGYGLIYPATSATYPDVESCILITLLTAFESFVGVVFSSLCAALVFAKVGRVQSFAQLTFSAPMVIRYGRALTTTDGSPDDDDDDEYNNNQSGDRPKIILNDHRIPCPVLEFRIFNRMDSLPGGEVMDATLKMTACIDVSQSESEPLLFGQGGRREKGKKGKRQGSTQQQDSPDKHLCHENGCRNEGNVRTEKTDLSVGKLETDSLSAIDNMPSSKKDTPALSVAMGNDSVASHNIPLPQKISLQRRAVSDSFNRQNLLPLYTPQLTPRQNHVQSYTIRTHEALYSATTSMDSSSSRRRTSMIDRIRVNSRGWRREKQDSNDAFFGGHNRQSQRHRSTRNRNTQAYEEDPSGKILPKKILAKLDVDASDHPFFRRIWLVRHTLDVNSLLLKPHVREMLRQHNGHWPKELNNYESIRSSIGFDQILVSVSGTSNAAAHSVYAHHVYHLVDVNVGYRFVDALYRDDRDGSLRVDHSLINDVIEQEGGGGEPLQQFDGSNYQEIMML